MRFLLPAAAFFLVACNGGQPAAPSEQWISSIVMNECKKIGVEVRVKFKDEDVEVPASIYGEEGLYACMAATSGVVYVYPICSEKMNIEEIRAYARHECCHAFFGHKGTVSVEERIRQEQEAEQCVREMF